MAERMSEASCQDPLKLWIADVNRMTQQSKTNCTFRGLPVRKVDICGIIRSYDNSKPTVVFTVDDTTGMVTCTSNYANAKSFKDLQELSFLDIEIKDLETSSEITPELSEALQQITAHTQNKIKTLCNFKLGDCVQVRGFLSDFHGELRINAFEVFKMSSSQEINRMCEMKILYRNLYDHMPSHMPSRMPPSQASTSDGRTGSSSKNVVFKF